MIKRSGCMCLLLGVALMTGCLEESKPQAKVEPAKPQMVVVDLDAVADSLGLRERLTRTLQAANAELIKKREAAQQQLQTLLTDRRAEIGEEPTEEQKKEWVNMANQARAKMAQIDQEIQAISVRNKQAVIAQVRAEIKPFVESVAKRHGATVVAEKSSLFWAEKSLDISDDVIAELKLEVEKNRAAAAAKPAAPKPAADGAKPSGQ